ncbi:hypothetical protein EBBID32_45190 [Sphingobium indicum BiD32]|uniref:Uncharacterized protein n=1 Tax=Sphingobium indicum BiD32 TaxID=1301087 RepID=N1MY19_9SPHN|nr:hypothetical protein EBBID32_45190 [Sphingobium indicum BiD32]
MMANIGIFIAGFVSFLLMIIAGAAPFVYRAIRQGVDW